MKFYTNKYLIIKEVRSSGKEFYFYRHLVIFFYLFPFNFGEGQKREDIDDVEDDIRRIKNNHVKSQTIIKTIDE